MKKIIIVIALFMLAHCDILNKDDKAFTNREISIIALASSLSESSTSQDETTIQMEVEFYDPDGNPVENPTILTEEEFNAKYGLNASFDDDPAALSKKGIFGAIVKLVEFVVRASVATVKTVRYVECNKKSSSYDRFQVWSNSFIKGVTEDDVDWGVNAVKTGDFSGYATNVQPHLLDSCKQCRPESQQGTSCSVKVVKVTDGNKNINIPPFVPDKLFPPIFSPAPGLYNKYQKVEMFAYKENIPLREQGFLNIRYTIDGSEPVCDNSSKLYNNPIIISKKMTIRARTCFRYYTKPVEYASADYDIQQYTISGNVTGLDSGTLTLKVENFISGLSKESEVIALSTNGQYTTSSLPSRFDYAVSIESQPLGRTCFISNGSGVINDNVTNVDINCLENQYTVSGTVSGLNGEKLKIKNNGTDEITVMDGSFAFPSPIVVYDVKVSFWETIKTCTISNGSGTAYNNITNVTINCSPCNGSTTTYPWGTFTDCQNGLIKFDGVSGSFGGSSYTAQTLFFMKCVIGQEGTDCKGTGNSSNKYGAQSMNHSSFISACSNLNSMNFYGKTNWRGANIQEIKTNVTCNNGTSMPINSDPWCGASSGKYVNFFDKSPPGLWSTTTSGSFYAWVVQYDGYPHPNDKGDPYLYYARCIFEP